MKYLVYFEIYGKKMKVEVEANNKCEARDVVRSSIIFHKTVEQENSIIQQLQKMMGMGG